VFVNLALNVMAFSSINNYMKSNFIRLMSIFALVILLFSFFPFKFQ
jgi:hypothetical protein